MKAQEQGEFGEIEDLPGQISEIRSRYHRRIERWLRLQRFVYGLSSDYAYALFSKKNSLGASEISLLMITDWLSWFGRARASDGDSALATALLEPSEALSADGSKTFFHEMKRWVRLRIPFFRSRNSNQKKDLHDRKSVDRLVG